ncbi:MAG: tetratricopeptide repeat protein [Sedimentisphaerales bacterium]|nr:tetratricopeptide repeat protein [Sedimentisphaerales bacterium]
METLKHITIICLLAVILPVSAAPAKEASVLLQEGLYAEEIEGDLDAAIAIYEKVIQDRSAQRSNVAQALYRQGMCYLKRQREQQAKLAFEKLITEYSDQTQVVNKAKPLLQELGSADPAALMPSNTLFYVELGSPGKQVETILNMLKGTPLENPLAAIGNAHQDSGAAPGDIVSRFLNPSMMAELKKVRGAGMGITRVVTNDQPEAVVVLFPGKSDALRGLLFGALAIAGKPVEAIEGMQTVELPEGGAAAYDDTIVIMVTPPAYKAGQLAWCVKRYKGIGPEPTLASSNTSFTKISKKDRQENAFTVWANVDQLYTDLMDVLPAGQVPEEILKANALTDFAHIDDLIAYVSLKEDGIALEANVDFKDGYSSFAYNMFRTPKLSKAALEVVPPNAIGLLSVAWGGADSPQSYAIREQIRKGAGLDIGGDIFVNIEQITLFAIPSAGAVPESLAGAPPIVGSLGLALKSPRPQDTRRILTGVLMAANLIASQSADEDPEQKFGRYQLQLVNNHTIHCYTDQKSETTVLSLNPNVIDASVSALGRRPSAAAEGSIRNALNQLSADMSKLVLINVGGAIRTGGDMFLSEMDEPDEKVQQLIDQLARSCGKTTVQFRTQEESDGLNVRVELRDLPPADEFFTPMMQLSQMVEEAKAKAWAGKKEAGIPASIRKASRPVVIDGGAEDLWFDAREYKIGNVIYSPVSSDEDFSASYRALWDAENLYLLVYVTDDSLKNDSDEFWQDDAVEVFIDADNSKSGGYGDNDFQFHFGWAETNPSMGESQHDRTDGVEFTVRRAHDGYRVEIKLPWSTLGTEPSVGSNIGLDVHVNDDDDGGDRDTKLTWWGKEDNAWQNPRALGTAELAGLVGWWKLDETRGTGAEDSSDNANNGTLMGGPRWVPSGGKVGGALEFDGNDDYVDSGYTDNLACWTVAAWVKSPAAPSGENQSGPVHREKNYQINWNHMDDAFRGSAGVCVGGQWHGAGFGNLRADTWYHLAATYDGENLKAYKDGKLITDNGDPSGPPEVEGESLKFGRHAMNEAHFRGTVDDVRVYNYALNDDEIGSIYNESK